MNTPRGTVVRHACEVPGCSWHHDQQLPVLHAGITWDEMLVGAEASAREAAAAWRTHQAEHYLPEPADGEPPLINALTDADGNPAIRLGPDVAAVVTLTTVGHAQIVGKEGVDVMALGEAMVNAGRALLDAEDGNPRYVPPSERQEDQG